jgi:GT2 family glycosyltransferase
MGERALSFKASVIVPAHDAAKTIEECLEALCGQEGLQGGFEVLVVDDGSQDETPELVDRFAKRSRRPPVRLIRQERAGPAAARNRGAGEARGGLLAFTDSDCVPDPTWLLKLLKPLENPEVAGSKGAYQTQQKEVVARFVQIEYESKYRHMERFREIDFIDTYSAGFRRTAFEQAGGFDTEFRTASVEDQEFSFRLAQMGHRMVFVPDAVVQHRHADSIWGYFRKKVRIGFYKLLLLRKHPGRLRGDTHTPRSLMFQVLLVLLLGPAVALCATGVLPSLLLWAWLAAHLASMGPFLVRAWSRDRFIAVCAPAMITCRAAALAMGLAAGAICLAAGCVRGPERVHQDQRNDE